MAGFDLVTGWGSPNGTALIGALASTPTSPNFTISASPTSVSLAPGASGTSTVTIAVSGGFDSAITLSATGVPTGCDRELQTGFHRRAGVGNRSHDDDRGLNAAPAGTHTITITGTSGATTHTATLSLTVTAPVFTITASPASVSVAQGGKVTSTVTTTVSGGLWFRDFSDRIGLAFGCYGCVQPRVDCNSGLRFVNSDTYGRVHYGRRYLSGHRNRIRWWSDSYGDSFAHSYRTGVHDLGCAGLGLDGTGSASGPARSQRRFPGGFQLCNCSNCIGTPDRRRGCVQSGLDCGAGFRFLDHDSVCRIVGGRGYLFDLGDGNRWRPDAYGECFADHNCTRVHALRFAGIGFGCTGSQGDEHDHNRCLGRL